MEGVPVTDIYYGIAWFATLASTVLLVIGLFNAELWLSEKGFYGMSFTLSLFAGHCGPEKRPRLGHVR